MNFKQIALGLLLCSSSVAFAQYKPSYTVVKSYSRFEVNKDASYTQYLEEQDRVDTPQGIRMLGERKITYNSTLETVEVFEYIEGLIDPVRRHKHLDQLSPLEFERCQIALWRVSTKLMECQYDSFN